MNPLNQMTMNQMAMARYGLQPNPAAYVHPAQAGYAAALIHGQGTRKNATRESTQQLKMWLNEHQKNPYPTKAEKVMLAILSGMTLTQVSTWFANARRRLKKENKWSPDGSCDDGSEAGDSNSLPDSAPNSAPSSRLPSTQPSTLPDESGYSSSDRDAGSPHPPKPESSPSKPPQAAAEPAQVVTIPSRPPLPDMLPHLHPYAAAALAAQHHHHHLPHVPAMPRFMPVSSSSTTATTSSSPPSVKPKRAARSLWSIADIAGDDTNEEEVDVTA